MSKAKRPDEYSLKRAHSVADDPDDELDWSYTARCTKEWSDDELLSHLCSQAFTIPARDYNPSAPFVYVRTEDCVTTTLPHGYRLPLMFIAKYQWETTTRTLSLQNRQRWEAVRDELLHLSRLCHALFAKARAEAQSSGMEKGWRCIMFDRVLTRFYKGWPVSSPAKLEAFLSHFGPKEYDRDVLKYDWKRWALKGFFRHSSSPTVHLTEEDVNDGITAVDLKIHLSKIDNVWTFSTGSKKNSKRRPLKFMQAMDYSSSELTDFDLSEDLDLDEDDESAEITRNTNLSLAPPFVLESPAKRGRELSEDDDSQNRSGKRAKLEEIIRSIPSRSCTPPDGSGSGDVFEEDDNHNHVDPLPKFRVPRQTLHSHGWRRLSAMDDLASQCRREEEEQANRDVVPAYSFVNSSTSISTSPSLTSTTTIVPSPSIPPDHLMDDPLSCPAAPNSKSVETALDVIHPPFTSSLRENTSLSTSTLTSISSKSQGKRPQSASTNHTTISSSLRNPRNSAYVSIPSSSRLMKQRARLSAPTSIPPAVSECIRSSMSSPMTRRGEGITATSKGVGSRVVKSNSEIKYEDLSPTVVRGGRQTQAQAQPRRRRSSSLVDTGWPLPDRAGAADTNGAKGKDKDKVVKTKEKKRKEKTVKEKKSAKDSQKSFGIQDSGPSLANASSNSTTNNNIDEGGEQDDTMMTSATTAAITTPSIPHPLHDPPPNLDLVHTKSPEFEHLVSMVDPKRVLMTNPSDAASSSNSVPAITADAESDSRQARDRIRELKTRFLGFKDELGRIIERLEVLEGVEGVVGGENLGRGVGIGGSSSHPDFVAQASQTEEKRKRKEKESRDCDLDVEIMGVSRSGAIPCHVNAAVGVDGLVVFRDASVQTDESTRSASGYTTIAVQAVDVSSATSLPETDELSNAKNIEKIKHTLLESGIDESFPPQTQFTNTNTTSNSLSTIVDNLVSMKMLSMMQTLVKSSINGNDNGKAKPVESATAATNTTINTTTAESDSEMLHQPSPSSSSLSLSACHSMDAYDNIAASLLDELKTIKEEARCREQSEKEDLLAMRQLHSAEVDALRRRLSYLESRDLGLGEWENGSGGSGGGGGRWRGSSSMRVDPLDLDRHHHRQFYDGGSNPDYRTSFRQQQYGDRSQTHHHCQDGPTRHLSSASIVNAEGESTSTARTTTTPTPQSSYTPLSLRKNNPLREAPLSIATADSNTSMSTISSLPTPTPPTSSERSHSFGFSKNSHHSGHGMDLDDDILNPLLLSLPLPVKSQRKQRMMALARAQFS